MSIIVDFLNTVIVNIGNVPLEINSRGIRGGAECIFIPISSQQGMKLFYYRDEAKRSLVRQKQGFEYGVAPSCGNKIYRVSFTRRFHALLNSKCDGDFNEDFYFDPGQFRKDHSWYGYLTQVVSTKKFVKSKTLNNLGCKILRKMNIDPCDICPNNVGFIGKRCVMVDWGDLSCSG